MNMLSCADYCDIRIQNFCLTFDAKTNNVNDNSDKGSLLYNLPFATFLGREKTTINIIFSEQQTGFMTEF